MLQKIQQVNKTPKTIKKTLLLLTKLTKLLLCSSVVTVLTSMTSMHAYAQQQNSVASSGASEQISAFIAASQVDQALLLIQKELAQKPKDPTLMFQRGISLAVLGRHDEAMADFLFLTKEYPTLPEPYHNLAIIYSHKNDFNNAKNALDMAIQNNPSYASAYDNLGDVYTKLAAQSYQKAQELDTSNLSSKSKMDLLFGITSIPIGSKQVYNNPNNMNVNTVNAGNTNVNDFNATNTAMVENTSNTKTKHDKKMHETDIEKTYKADKKEKVDKKIAKKEVKEAKEIQKIEKLDKNEKVASSETKETKETKTTNLPKITDKANLIDSANNITNTSNTNDQDNIKKSLQNWSGAWSSKNTDGYLNAYSPTFKPLDGTNKEAWAVKRKARISEKGEINVAVQDPQININGNKATVVFKQVYKSDKLRDINQKTLEMVKVNGEWKIEREKSF